MDASVRHSIGSSPAWQNSSVLTPNALSVLSLTPGTTANVSISPDTSALWFDAAAASYSENVPLLNEEADSEENDTDVSNGEEEERPLLAKPQPTVQPSGYETRVRSIVYGFILAVILLPLIPALASIIFKDKFFEPYLGSLVRHVFLSCAVQQSVMMMKSTLPFAIGQVQDIGLFFMNTMATAVVKDKLPDDPTNEDKEFVLGGVIFLLSISTFIVGVLVIAVSVLRLASLVQYVPLPVIGGYLGYLGYFFFVSGAFIATNINSNGFESYPDLFSLNDDWHSCHLFKVLIAFACFLFIHVFVSKIKHPSSLPVALVIVPAVFYISLFCSGKPLDNARNDGWLPETSENGSESKTFIDIWEMANFHEFQNYFDLIPTHMKTIIPLFLLVAFGSSLDIAAIQQEYTKEIDFNRELGTVGFQNVIAGISFAGYTGSYIFSMTLFSLRNGIDTRLAGCIVAVVEFLVFLAPISPVDYIPKFYLGGLAMWIGYGIFVDWLIYSYSKVNFGEYVLIWVTFLCVLFFELTYGLLLGALFSMLVFIFCYARANIAEIRIIPSKRCVVKTVEQRAILDKFRNNMTAVSLSGYVFFGSSVAIGKKLFDSAISQRTKLLDSLDEYEELLRSAIIDSPLVLIVDMKHVQGVDATAARTLGTVRRSLAAEGIKMFVTNLDKHQNGIKRLLEAHSAILLDCDEAVVAGVRCGQNTQDCPTGAFFTSTDTAVSYCEDVFLNVAVRHGLSRRDSVSLTFAEVLRSHLETPKMLVNLPRGHRPMSSVLSNYLNHRRYRRGDHLFRIDDPSDEIYIVGRGTVSLQTCVNGIRHPVLDYGPGGVLGDSDFYLGRPRSFDALSIDVSEVWIITRDAFERLIVGSPNIAICLQHLILHSAALSAVGVLQLLGRAQADE